MAGWDHAPPRARAYLEWADEVAALYGDDRKDLVRDGLWLGFQAAAALAVTDAEWLLRASGEFRQLASGASGSGGAMLDAPGVAGAAWLRTAATIMARAQELESEASSDA